MVTSGPSRAAACALFVLASALTGCLRSEPGSGGAHVDPGVAPAVSPAGPAPLEAPLTDCVPEVAARVEAERSEVRRAPGEAARWVRLGMVYEANSMRELAASSYEEALRLQPDDA